MTAKTYTDTEIEKLIEENRRLTSVETYLRVINQFAVSISSRNTVDQILWTIAKHVMRQLFVYSKGLILMTWSDLSFRFPLISYVIID